MKIGRRGATPFVVATAVAMLAGCGPAATTGAGEQRPARFVHGNVVLTPLGKQRLGLQTATSAASGKETVVPVGALLYEPSGQTAVYTQSSALIYTIKIINVANITGNVVFISSGLAPGTVVVTQGAIELLGVQNGIGVET